MAAAGIQAPGRRRLYLCGLLAALCALGGFLWQTRLLTVHYWQLLLLCAGFAFSYFLPQRFRQNAGYGAAIVAFLFVGILLFKLREELDGQVIISTYRALAVDLLLISSFRAFGRSDVLLLLGLSALLCVVSCSIAITAVTLSAALLFLLLALAALYRAPRRAVKTA